MSSSSDDQKPDPARHPWAAIDTLSYALAIISVAVLSYQLSMLVRLPIYADESQWKIIGSRLLIDGPELQYLFPGCDAGFRLQIPVTWYPSRLLDSLLYADLTDPMRLRIFGVASYLAIVAALGFIFWSRVRGRLPATMSLAAPFILTSLGVLPALLVLNRPEQSLLIPFVVLVGGALALKDRQPVNKHRAWLVAAACSLLVMLMLGAHIKSFVLLPSVLVLAWVAIRRPTPFIAFLVIVAVALAQTYSLWEARTRCPELAHLDHVFKNLSISPRMLLSDTSSFFHQLVSNIQGSWQYLAHASIAPEYQSQWLPSGTVGPLDHLANVVLYATSWTLVAVSVAGASVGLWRSWKERLPGGVFEPAVIILLLAALLALCAYQTTKNFYETALVWPVLLLAALLGSAALLRVRWIRTCARYSAPIALSVVLIGQLAFTAQVQQDLPSWESQAAARPALLAELALLSDECGIARGHSQRGLVVTDFSYAEYWRTERPFLLPYFEGWWATGLNQQNVISKYNLTHYIGECRQLPASARQSRISTSETFCCGSFSP